MGVAIDTFGLLADSVSTAQDFVAVFFYVYILLIFVYVLTSWITLPQSLNWLQRFLNDVCTPYLGLFRRILPALGPLDVSPIVGVLVLVGVQQLAVRLIGTLD